MDAKDIAEGLQPLWQAYLTNMVERGWTHTDEGGLADTILSSCCDKGLATWSMPDPDKRHYVNKYMPTTLGREVASLLQEKT